MLSKYSCRSFDDVIGNEDVVRRLQTFVCTPRRIHLILVGPEGIGKRNLIEILINHLYGEKRDGLLYFSSSCDRSIQNIRDTVQNFVSKKTFSGEIKQMKMIVFEDAETISEGVQQLMRSVIEKNLCSSIMCIFLCHKVDSLIESLQSRCLTLKMEKIGRETLYAFVENLGQKENVAITSKAINVLVDKVSGDVRQAINYFELLSYDVRRPITEEIVQEVCLFPCYASIKTIFESIRDRRNALVAMREMQSLIVQGFSGIDILGFLQEYLSMIESKMSTEEEIYSAFVNELAVTTLRLKEGVNSYTQLCGMFARLVDGMS